MEFFGVFGNFWNFLEIFLEFFRNFFGIFLKEFFGGIFFGEIFLEDFFGGFFWRIIWRIFLGGILKEEFFIYIGIDLFVKILSQWRRRRRARI